MPDIMLILSCLSQSVDIVTQHDNQICPFVFGV
jgi:hypothetical protein